MKQKYIDMAPQLAIPIDPLPEHYDYDPEKYSTEDIESIKKLEEKNRKINEVYRDNVNPDVVSFDTACIFHYKFLKEKEHKAEVRKRITNDIIKRIFKFLGQKRF